MPIKNRHPARDTRKKNNKNVKQTLQLCATYSHHAHSLAAATLTVFITFVYISDQSETLIWFCLLLEPKPTCPIFGVSCLFYSTFGKNSRQDYYIQMNMLHGACNDPIIKISKSGFC